MTPPPPETLPQQQQSPDTSSKEHAKKTSNKSNMASYSGKLTSTRAAIKRTVVASCRAIGQIATWTLQLLFFRSFHAFIRRKLSKRLHATKPNRTKRRHRDFVGPIMRRADRKLSAIKPPRVLSFVFTILEVFPSIHPPATSRSLRAFPFSSRKVLVVP